VLQACHTRHVAYYDLLRTGIADAERMIYDAMDWLLERQDRIEKELANKHLGEGSTVLYDVTSSYYEGHTCPLRDMAITKMEKRVCRYRIWHAYGQEAGPLRLQVYPGIR